MSIVHRLLEQCKDLRVNATAQLTHPTPIIAAPAQWFRHGRALQSVHWSLGIMKFVRKLGDTQCVHACARAPSVDDVAF